MNKIYNDKIYYIIKFEYYSEEKWALWFTSDKDGVITENGKIYCFDSERSLKIYCRKMKWVQAIRSYIERLKMPMALVI